MWKKLASAGLALPILLAAGCAVGPDYVRPSVDTPAAFKELAGWKAAQPRDDIPRGQWWKIYQDPLLNELEAQVSISNQNLAQAEAQVRAARALAQSARAGYFPSVSGSVSSTRSGGQATGTNTLHALSLDASWEADIWGKIRRTVESAEATAQAAAGDWRRRGCPHRLPWRRTTSSCANWIRKSGCSTIPSPLTPGRFSSPSIAMPPAWWPGSMWCRRRPSSSSPKLRRSTSASSGRNWSTPSRCWPASRPRSFRCRRRR